MARTKQKKHISNPTDRVSVARQNEKIINDLLLQFAYTLAIGVITIFVYNALGRFSYGLETYNGVKTVMWILFAVSLVAGIVLTVLYKINNKYGIKISAIYSYVTSLVAFWYVGVEKIPYYLKNVIPFLEKFSGSQKVIFAMFPLLGIAIVAEFVVYFVRYYSVNSKKKK